MIRKMKIAGLPREKDFNALPFGRQYEWNAKIAEFKAGAKKVHLSQKRQSYHKAIRDAVALYDVAEYYCVFECGSDCKDDSFEFFYKGKS